MDQPIHIQSNKAFYSTQGELIEPLNMATVNDKIFLYGKEIELQRKIKQLLSSGLPIRAHGASHSNYFDNAFYKTFNEINVSNFVIPPTINGDILTASAGESLDNIRNFLKPYNLKLLATPESKFITLGGAVLVGAHHGSHLHKTMADYVTEMLLFDGNGDVKRITDKKLFVNFGLYGIVFRISIKCFPATNMYWKRILYDNIDDIIITPNTHSLVFGPYSKKILEAQIFPTDISANKSINRYFWEIVPDLLSTKYITKIVSNFSRFMFYVFPFMGLLVSEYFVHEPSVVRDKFDYFEMAPQTNVYTQEYAVDVRALKNVYFEMMQLIDSYKQIGTYVSYRFWVRFVPKSDVPNTLTYDNDSAVFEITYSKDQPNAYNFAIDIDKIFRKYNGKPHIGKTLISNDSLTTYNFEQLKKEISNYDPKGVFQNSFIKEALSKH
ncbi:hypothetical protein QJ856_gp0800 [Tupanvirus deep ocean]|uniref:Uncharacterized protein n=2 Tax=Tupanvirus TaxID=2094720 RepID=A0AC62A8K7_9VIRU|nr:hypothetical protein QJ856_gp0800 [Tupanvirus deep ocean]QKU33953.1 hypothetical protein [Tupanvirus deep ocean]